MRNICILSRRVLNCSLSLKWKQQNATKRKIIFFFFFKYRLTISALFILYVRVIKFGFLTDGALTVFGRRRKKDEISSADKIKVHLTDWKRVDKLLTSPGFHPVVWSLWNVSMGSDGRYVIGSHKQNYIVERSPGISIQVQYIASKNQQGNVETWKTISFCITVGLFIRDLMFLYLVILFYLFVFVFLKTQKCFFPPPAIQIYCVLFFEETQRSCVRYAQLLQRRFKSMHRFISMHRQNSSWKEMHS